MVVRQADGRMSDQLVSATRRENGAIDLPLHRRRRRWAGAQLPRGAIFHFMLPAHSDNVLQSRPLHRIPAAPLRRYSVANLKFNFKRPPFDVKARIAKAITIVTAM